jgi:hypothetical protein
MYRNFVRLSIRYIVMPFMVHIRDLIRARIAQFIAYRRLIADYEARWARRRAAAEMSSDGAPLMTPGPAIRRGTINRIGMIWIRTRRAMRRWRRQWDSQAQRELQVQIENDAEAANLAKSDPFIQIEVVSIFSC